MQPFKTWQWVRTSLLFFVVSLLFTVPRGIAQADTLDEGSLPPSRPAQRVWLLGATSQPLGQETDPSLAGQLTCYIQTAKGQTFDLKRLCTTNLVRQLLSTGACRNCDLRGADLSYLDLSHLDLTGADLRGAHLQGSNLSGAKLEGAKLTGQAAP